MSLINDALKKAQRSRHGDAAPGAEASGSASTIAKHAEPKSARSMLVLGAGAVILVVASMVGTALWVTRPARPAATPPVIAPASPKTEPAAAAAPLLQLPPAKPVVAESKPAAAPVREPARPTPLATAKAEPAAPASSTPVKEPVAAVTESPAPPPPAPPAAAPKPDERIHEFVEAIKVTGIRSSGTESRVLMNDRVYRVNDIVDRALNVRLTKVATDSLTFTDANGVTYVKYF